MPTENQFHRLRMLGSGSIVIAPRRGDWNPLLKHGWVEPLNTDDKDKRFLPPLRITAAGYLALARGAAKFPPPDFEPRPRQLNETPEVSNLKDKLQEAQDNLRDARADLSQTRGLLSRVERVVKDWDR